LEILTANTKGAFTRSGRFDATFFVDLPGREQKDMIWKIWLGYYEIKTQPLPKDDKWTGADIRSCCNLAVLLDTTLEEASKLVIPVMTTSEDEVTKLRDFAHKRYLSADYKGLYNKEGKPDKMKLMPDTEVSRPKRRISRGGDPSALN